MTRKKNTPNPPEPSEIEKQTREQLEIRKWRAINYISFIGFYTLVYTVAILADYYLFWLIGFLLDLDNSPYPLVRVAIEFLKVSTTICGVISGFVHLGYATYGQIQLERNMNKMLGAGAKKSDGEADNEK
jgi:hypothetical protein